MPGPIFHVPHTWNMFWGRVDRYNPAHFKGASLVTQMVKICLQCRRLGLGPWVGKIPWRMNWKPTPVFWPGEFHRQGSLVGHSPWGGKELDMTE